MEAKAAEEDMRFTGVQAQYDGATIVYGWNKALEYM